MSFWSDPFGSVSSALGTDGSGGGLLGEVQNSPIMQAAIVAGLAYFTASGSLAMTGAGEAAGLTAEGVAAGTAESAAIVGGGSGAAAGTDLGLLGAGGAASSGIAGGGAGAAAGAGMLGSGLNLGQIASMASPVVGGLLGGQGQKTSQTQANSIDPRFAEQLYGAGGLLPAAKDWYSQNKSGLNQPMLDGMNNQYNQHAASGQGFNQMQNLGMGLLSGGAAGNPFAGGYTGGTDFKGGMNGNGGGIAPTHQSYTPAQSSAGISPFSMPVMKAAEPSSQASATSSATLPDLQLLLADYQQRMQNNSSGGN